MIEPHSAQEGESSWTWKATRVVPSDPLATVACPLLGPLPLQLAWPLPVTEWAIDSTTGRLIETGATSTATAVGRLPAASSDSSAMAGASD